jgi:uncharacterized membrane protein YfcA
MPVDLIALGSGMLVGLLLAAFGGGGSILATPLLVFAAGVSPHLAIGTSAMAVGVSAANSLVLRARAGMVRWRGGLVFAITGMLGALVGSTLGKHTNADLLLFAFGGLMLVVAAFTALRGGREGDADSILTRANAKTMVPKLMGAGMGVGGLSGFFGIGGGFLAGPSIAAATGLPLSNAAATSLIAVSAFGLTTAANYAFSGMISWHIAGVFILGGAIGSLIGSPLADVLAKRRVMFARIFAAMIALVGIYVLIRTGLTLTAG